MAPRIDERYAYLAVEEKYGQVSPLLDVAIKSRPVADFVFDKDYFVKTYGYDILTIAILSDSPLSSPLAKNFEGTLDGAWRLLNKLWAMRLNATNCDSISLAFDDNIKSYHKVIANIHINTQSIVEAFDNQKYHSILKDLYSFAPNFVTEIYNSMQ